MTIVLYGSFAVKWEVFEMAESCCYRHATTCCAQKLNIVGKEDFAFEFSSAMNKFSYKVGSLEVLRRTRRESNADKTQPLHEILWDHRIRQASEPRNLFYGLLVLTGMMVPTLIVDYRLPCEAVFKIATLLSIQQTGKLYIIQGKKNSQVRKPFWIHNFDNVVKEDLAWELEYSWLVDVGRYFTAAGTSKSVALWNDFEQEHLELKGIFCSKVVLVGDFWSSDDYIDQRLSSILIQ